MPLPTSIIVAKVNRLQWPLLLPNLHLSLPLQYVTLFTIFPSIFLPGLSGCHFNPLFFPSPWTFSLQSYFSEFDPSLSIMTANHSQIHIIPYLYWLLSLSTPLHSLHGTHPSPSPVLCPFLLHPLNHNVCPTFYTITRAICLKLKFDKITTLGKKMDSFPVIPR